MTAKQARILASAAHDGEGWRPHRLRDMQRAARRKRSDRRGLSRGAPAIRARQRRRRNSRKRASRSIPVRCSSSIRIGTAATAFSQPFWNARESASRSTCWASWRWSRSIAANVATGDTPAGGHYPATGTIDVAFTPGDRIDRLIVGEIDQSQHEVMMLAYSFTDRTIARALVRAHQRGVQVQVVADREQARALPQNVLADLVAGGVSVWVDGNFQAAHNKVIVIDAGRAARDDDHGQLQFHVSPRSAAMRRMSSCCATILPSRARTGTIGRGSRRVRRLGWMPAP